MKNFYLILIVLLGSMVTPLEGQTTATSNTFHACLYTMQNHTLPFTVASQSVTFRPEFPCFIVGGYQTQNTGWGMNKSIWSSTDPSTLARWDTLATVEAMNGVVRFLDFKGKNIYLPADALFLPNNTYTLHWGKLSGHTLTANTSKVGVSVLMFNPTVAR